MTTQRIPRPAMPDPPARPRLTKLATVESTPGYAWASVRWLRRQIYEGQLPSHKVGGIVLVDLDDLDALVDAGRRTLAS